MYQIFFGILASSSGDVIYFSFLFLVLATICAILVEGIIWKICVNLIHEELLFKDFSFLIVDGNFVQQRGTICVFLEEGIRGTFR